MNNQPPKQLMVIPGAVANQNQHTTPVALLDENGEPLSLGGSALTPGNIYAADLSSGATLLGAGTFDLSEPLVDTAGFYDVGEELILLPAGPYQISLFSNGTISGDSETQWIVTVSFNNEKIPVRSFFAAGQHKLGFKQMMYFTEPTYVGVDWLRDLTTSGAVEFSFMIQAL